MRKANVTPKIYRLFSCCSLQSGCFLFFLCDLITLHCIFHDLAYIYPSLISRPRVNVTWPTSSPSSWLPMTIIGRLSYCMCPCDRTFIKLICTMLITTPVLDNVLSLLTISHLMAIEMTPILHSIGLSCFLLNFYIIHCDRSIPLDWLSLYFLNRITIPHRNFLVSTVSFILKCCF